MIFLYSSFILILYFNLLSRFNMKKFLTYSFCFFLILFLWAFFVEPNWLGVKKYNIKNPQLAGLKIVFASDFHVSPDQINFLKKTVDLINQQNPDIVLLGGDFVKGHQKKSSLSPELIADELGNIRSKYGVFAVLGNHDWWYDGNEVARALARNGIEVLSNQNVFINSPDKKFYIAGVDDFTTGKSDLATALKNTAQPLILLSHNPDIFPSVPQGVALTLSGHTHGGQIALPFYGAIFTSSDYGRRFAYGLIEENNRPLLVTKGIGTSILPLRLFCTPEIVVVNFI